MLVTKKDGSTRFCVDYRKLNTKMDVFPFPVSMTPCSLASISSPHWIWHRAQACHVLLSHSHYALVDDVLYHLEPGKSLRIVPPAMDRELFHEAHSGPLGGQLRDAEVYCQLSQHYKQMGW